MSKPGNTGEALLLRLRELGVTHFFANPGTEFVSVIQGFARLPKEKIPEPVLCPHELLAVSMAHGAYLRTGLPQAVMTHANVGAANALIGLIGAARMNVPLIFLAGATAATERGCGARDKLIHWAQEEREPSYRGVVKWEAEVRDPSQLAGLLDRAYAVAMTEPRGPVALKLARDLLVAPSPALPGKITLRAAGEPAPAPSLLLELLARLEIAERPLLLTNRLGKNPAHVPLLVRAAERHAIGVLTPEDYYASFPSSHPLHFGFTQAQLREADFVIVLDTDAPWYPIERGPAESAFVAHVGVDPLFAQTSARSHRGDLFLTSGSAHFLAALEQAPAPASALQLRRRTWLERAKSALPPVDDNLTAAAVSQVLGTQLRGHHFLVNELGLLPAYLGARPPGSYARSTSASPLGSGLGYALGAAVVNPQVTPIAAIGDGVALLSPLPAALSLAAGRGIGLVVLVLNNGGYRSVESAARSFYPELAPDLPLTVFPPDLRFERFADFVGGFGAAASSKNELQRQLAEAIAFAESKKLPAVVHARMAPGDPGAGCTVTS
jgi:acetolactate synthase-1/2/3 large subunit